MPSERLACRITIDGAQLCDVLHIVIDANDATTWRHRGGHVTQGARPLLHYSVDDRKVGEDLIAVLTIPTGADSRR